MDGTVLHSVAGSLTTAVAEMGSGRRFIVAEKDSDRFQLTLERLEKLSMLLSEPQSSLEQSAVIKTICGKRVRASANEEGSRNAHVDDLVTGRSCKGITLRPATLTASESASCLPS